jgi:hypothetical protein
VASKTKVFVGEQLVKINFSEVKVERKVFLKFATSFIVLVLDIKARKPIIFGWEIHT